MQNSTRNRNEYFRFIPSSSAKQGINDNASLIGILMTFMIKSIIKISKQDYHKSMCVPM